jgi:hypothetical protein
VLRDLIWIIQQAIGQAGGEAVWVIAAAAGGSLIRRALRHVPKTTRTRRYIIDVGAARIAVVIAIGRKPQGRKSLPGAAAGDCGARHAEERQSSHRRI